MDVIRVNLDEITEQHLPSITQATLNTVDDGCVRCLNSRFMPDEDKAIALLEFAARVCYKSDTKKTDALRLIRHLYSREHFSVFEHVNYSFVLSSDFYNLLLNVLTQMERVDRFTVEKLPDSKYLLVTCNLRSFIELYQFKHYVQSNEESLISGIIWTMSQVWPKLYSIFVSAAAESLYSTLGSLPLTAEYQIDIPCLVKERNIRYAFHVVCSRVIANQLTRHRTLSFSQESTRFISYAKHGSETVCTFIPDSMKERQEYIDITSRNADSCMSNYLQALAAGLKPEDARDNLPLSLKTELVVSGTYNINRPEFLYDGLARLISLRVSNAAQPAISEIVKKMAFFISKSQKEID